MGTVYLLSLALESSDSLRKGFTVSLENNQRLVTWLVQAVRRQRCQGQQEGVQSFPLDTYYLSKIVFPYNAYKATISNMNDLKIYTKVPQKACLPFQGMSLLITFKVFMWFLNYAPKDYWLEFLNPDLDILLKSYIAVFY